MIEREKTTFGRFCSNSRFCTNIIKYKYTYMLILPALIYMIIFSYIPLGGIILAFKDYNIFDGVWGSRWVGFDNFITIFNHDDMLLGIKNTLIYGCVILFCGFPFPIILALMFNEIRNIKFKKFSQTVIYMPHFLSWISVIGMMYALFAIDGSFNQLLRKIIGSGYQPKNILLDSNFFLPVIFLSHLWKSCGWSSIIFLAAIAGIDPSLYESATIDGCGKFKQVIYITLPCILTTAIIVLVMSLGSMVNVNFEQVYGLQNAYTQEKTEVIGTLIYRLGIQNGKYSLSTAFGIAQGIVSMILTLTANAFAKKAANVSIW